MRKIIIVKMGSALPALLAKKGDFEDYIRAGMQVSAEECQVVDVRHGDVLPEYEQAAGIVITGSQAMVTQHKEWSERAAAWIAGAAERGIPTLGICYGHQLLAYALGGEVGFNPRGREIGTVDVLMYEEASGDALLGGLDAPIRAQVCHAQSVLRLPEGARRLAHSQKEENQAFVVGRNAWGVQFHPEFDAEISRAYLDVYRKELSQEGQNADELAAHTEDASYGFEILKRFARIVKEKDAVYLNIHPVMPGEVGQVLEVYRQCEDFLALGPQPKASLEMVLMDIEHSHQEGGRFCGIYNSEKMMIGVVDYIPSGFEGRADQAFLSLLMIAAPLRRQGIGSEIVRRVEGEILKNPQVKVICSGVQVNNPQAIRFWKRHGYKVISGPELLPDQTTVFRLRKML